MDVGDKERETEGGCGCNCEQERTRSSHPVLHCLGAWMRLEARRSQREQCRKCEKCARWLVFQARRDSLQSSAKRNMALCSSQELRGRKRREGAKKSVRAYVHVPVCVYVCGEEGQAKSKDKGFPRALPSPLAKRC